MTMQQESPSVRGTILLSLLGGAALGAIVVALTTPKTGQEVRGSLKSVVNRFRARNVDAEEALDELADELIEALFI